MPPCEVGKKVYINGTGHMTKMAAMLIYEKKTQKSNRPRYQVSVYGTMVPWFTDAKSRQSRRQNISGSYNMSFTLP